ncbi:uncharacterized protein [Diadema setosum]|uniref:uncharacterized protein n=1 Tax=Diadema setosum TaxID=31175 RepID=UPI003B3ABED8
MGNRRSHPNILIAGDLNHPDINWESQTTSNRTSATTHQKLLDILLTNSLFQLVRDVTRPSSGNVLDLICTSNPSFVTNVEVLPGISDHHLLTYTINLSPNQQSKPSRKIHQFNKADVDQLQEATRAFSAEFFLSDPGKRSVESNWMMISNFLNRCLSELIPSKMSKGKRHLPWITQDIKQKMRKRDRLFKKAFRQGTTAAWKDFRKFRNQVAKIVHEAHDNYINNIIGASLQDNPKVFWSYIRKCRTEVIGIPSLRTAVKLCSAAAEKAEVLNNFFHTTFTKEDMQNLPSKDQSPYLPIGHLHFDRRGVEKQLQQLNPSKASGPDEIPPKLLKLMAHEIAPVLSFLFQQSYNTGTIPSQWKQALVSPIHKSGEKNDPSNYRPISLTCIACKIMEHVILSHVSKHLASNKILTDTQHGFRQGLSATTQLSSAVHDWSSILQKRSQVDTIFLDFQKAFDRVPHQRLRIKLQYYGISGDTLNWIMAFLSDRTQCVVVDGSKSSWQNVPSGVPQGSVIGPTLFLIFINDIQENIKSSLRLFADDCVIYKEILSDDDHHILQKDLLQLSSWSTTWQMKFNVEKCAVLSITRKRTPDTYTYRLGKDVIPRAKEYKYLGVTVTTDLRWNQHCQNIRNKASRTLGLVRRTLSPCSKEVKSRAYTALVRPQLEYASEAWNPHTVTAVNLLEQSGKRYGLVLILTLTISVFWVSNSKASVVSTVPNVVGWRGEQIRLPCDFHEEPLAVVWVKETISAQQTKAGFFDGNFQSTEERFNMNRNFSLVITDLEVADEGLYLCQVALINLETFENSTLMTVNSMASRHAIEECLDESLTNQGLCLYQTPSNTLSLNLTCVVSGFKPNISLLWTDETGKRLNSVVSQQTTLSDDTYERFETITVSAKQGVEQTFMCVATGDSLNVTSTAEITVLPISEKHDNLGLTIGLGIGLLVILLFLLVGLLLKKYRLDYLRKACGWTLCWRLREAQPYDLEGLVIDSLPTCPPLTEEQVHQCKKDLKAYYRKTRRKVTVDPLNFMERVNLDEIYTNLSLIDYSDMRKIPITYENLLTHDECGNLSKRLLIQGEGGVGKTTLCAKIAWDWCQGKILQDLDMVIVIPLRDAIVVKTIGSIVERYLSDSNEATAAQIDDFISANLSKILLVFDGFDELSGKIERKSSSEVIRILGVERYESCKVIVTSRPWRTDEFRLNRSLAEAYTFVSVEGFNKENVSTYIKRYFRIRDREFLAETLLYFMEENDVIRSNMAPFPIYCAMLCLMWNDFSEERRKEMQKLQTFSEIFGEMITFLKEHYASKFCENLLTQNVVEDIEDASRAIQVISETALGGLLERKLSFPEKQFKGCEDAMETCCKVGVLTIERDIIDKKRRRDANIQTFVSSTVSFPHKLFQEYIAGIHIGHLFADDRPRYDKVKKKLLRQCEEFRYLLYFASASKKEVGLDIIDGLMKTDDQYFCLDVAFECHTEEAAIAVGKRWKDYKLSPDMAEHTKAGVVFTGKCNQAEKLLINDVKCGKTVSRYLAEGMCSSPALRNVTLKNQQLHTDFYMIMGKEASTCQIEDMTFVFKSLKDDFHDQSLLGENLARWMCTMPNISRVRLDCRYLNHDFLSTAVALASSCQIQDLHLLLDSWSDDVQYLSSMGENLARWVLTMPNVFRFALECPYLNHTFFSTAVTLASSCEIRELSMSFRASVIRAEETTTANFAEFLCQMPHLERADVTWRDLPKAFFTKMASKMSRLRACKSSRSRGGSHRVSILEIIPSHAAIYQPLTDSSKTLSAGQEHGSFFDNNMVSQEIFITLNTTQEPPRKVEPLLKIPLLQLMTPLHFIKGITINEKPLEHWLSKSQAEAAAVLKKKEDTEHAKVLGKKV